MKDRKIGMYIVHIFSSIFLICLRCLNLNLQKDDLQVFLRISVLSREGKLHIKYILIFFIICV